MKHSLRHLLSPTARGLAVLGFAAATGSAQAQVTAEQALGLKPKQSDVPYDVVKPEDIPRCTIKLEKFGGASGYVVSGPDGQPLRQLVDTNGDNSLNQFRYFQLGLETYRETDTNGDRKADEYRWLNTAGTRWGIDNDGDRKIDSWRRISAEEATREAIGALAAGDAETLASLMITAADTKTLRLEPGVARALLQRASDVPGQMKKALASGLISKQTRWERSDSAMLMPVLVPADSGKGSRDVVVYENVTAVAKNGRDDVFLDVGEVVQVGDTWKLTKVPTPLDPTKQIITDGGILMQPALGADQIPDTEFSKELQELLSQLDKLDQSRPDFNDRDAATKWNVDRSKLLSRIVDAAGSREQKVMFTQQRIDGIASAALLGSYPEPLDAMKRLESEVARDFKEFLPYVTFRRIEIESGERVRTAKDEEAQAAVQTWYLGELDKFVRQYPKADDSATAMWVLGYQYELAGNVKRAREWYEVVSKQFPQTPSGAKAAGALNRLAIDGRKLDLKGSVIGGGSLDLDKYRGKVVAVVFWATWSTDFNEKLPELLKLQREFKNNGFEVVGVNLDRADVPVEQFLKEQNVSFPSLDSGPAGMESEYARRFGIIKMPTVFLLDKSGKVVDSTIELSNLRSKVPTLLLAGMGAPVR